MADFPAPMPPFSPITEVFPDVFVATGGFKFGPGFVIPRNMTIIRQGSELTLINSVRLSPEREAELEKLGKVKHLIRIGAFHGLDDPYYVDRYKPAFWGPAGSTRSWTIETSHLLAPGEATPIEGASVFLFEKAKRPEAVLLLDREGGIAITCDSFQHWTSTAGCSLLGKVVMIGMGFRGPLIGGPWVGQQGTGVVADFQRLLDAPFKHALSAHGTPLEHTAKDGLRGAIEKRFKV